MALDEDIPEKPEDKTVPKYRQIDKVTRTLVAYIPCYRPLVRFVC